MDETVLEDLHDPTHVVDIVVSAQTEIRAVQDIGCLSAAKFVYHFPTPLPSGMSAAFGDCDVVAREFSKTIRSAKDLLSVKSRGAFRAEFIIGGTRAVVYFDGSARKPPLEAIDAFGQRLRAAGYGRILYLDGPRPQCHRCPAGIVKGCQTGTPG